MRVHRKIHTHRFIKADAHIIKLAIMHNALASMTQCEFNWPSEHRAIRAEAADRSNAVIGERIITNCAEFASSCQRVLLHAKLVLVNFRACPMQTHKIIAGTRWLSSLVDTARGDDSTLIKQTAECVHAQEGTGATALEIPRRDHPGKVTNSTLLQKQPRYVWHIPVRANRAALDSRTITRLVELTTGKGGMSF